MPLKKIILTGNEKSENDALKVAMLSGRKGRGVVGFELPENACVEFVPTSGASLEIEKIGQWPGGLTVAKVDGSAKVVNKGVLEEEKHKAYKFKLNHEAGGQKQSIDPVIIPR